MGLEVDAIGYIPKERPAKIKSATKNSAKKAVIRPPVRKAITKRSRS